MLEQDGEERKTIALDPDTHGEYLEVLDRRIERLQDKILSSEVVKAHPYFKEDLLSFLNEFARAYCYVGHLMTADGVTENELAVLDGFVEEEKKWAK